MGRETIALVRWQGQHGEARLLLESTELILRGSVKARFARSAIEQARAADDGLTLTIDGAELRAAMSAAEAARWVKAIATPPPSLAAKLGIGPDRPAFVAGAADDPELARALSGARAAALAQAAVLLAVIEDHAGLEQALVLAQAHPALAVWCIYPKGKAAGDSAIRAAFRAAGWMDNKTAAVSGRLTATRYAHKA